VSFGDYIEVSKLRCLGKGLKVCVECLMYGRGVVIEVPRLRCRNWGVFVDLLVLLCTMAVCCSIVTLVVASS
jgi:hypothetical protein